MMLAQTPRVRGIRRRGLGAVGGRRRVGTEGDGAARQRGVGAGRAPHRSARAAPPLLSSHKEAGQEQSNRKWLRSK